MDISKLLYRMLILVLVAVLLISSTFVARYVIDSLEQKKEYDKLAAQVAQSRTDALLQSQSAQDANSAAAETPPEDGSTPPTEATEPSILPEYVAAYEENSDLVGWMVIDGTPINYPVMQTPDQPDYYLYRNFRKEDNAHGCLYVRESCDVFAPSDNVTIYGHHMKNGSMFTGLDKFRDSKFWKQHQTIVFDTLYEHHSYTVFAVFTTTASKGKGFSYHRFEYAADEAEFNEFVATCKALALYDTGITPQYGDKLISLSTCEYSQENGRLVVVAVRN